MKKRLINIFLLVLLSLANAAPIAAQATQKATSKVPEIISDPMNYMVLFALVILLSAVLVMARIIRLLTWQLAGKPKAKSATVEIKTHAKKESIWSKLDKKLNDAVPVEKEADVLLDHDYDGIKELDNNLPPWWKYGFYLTIIFAFIYLFNYHVIGSGNVQLDEYNEQLAEADLQKAERLKLVANNVDETSVTVLVADADLASGQKIFLEKCMVCHGKLGEGNVGPNLTDTYWIHGGDIKDIFKIVKYGFPSKGMISWQGQLNPVQIQQVASYITTLAGTNPPNPKAPQGDLYSPESMVTTVTENASETDSVKAPTSTTVSGLN